MVGASLRMIQRRMGHMTESVKRPMPVGVKMMRASGVFQDPWLLCALQMDTSSSGYNGYGQVRKKAVGGASFDP